MTRDEYVNSIKSAFVTLGNKAAMTYLIAQFPFLATPVIRQLTEYFVNKIVSAIATETEMQAFFLYIDTRVGNQADAFNKSAYENYLAQQGNDENAKKLAEENLKRDFALFARLSS